MAPKRTKKKAPAKKAASARTKASTKKSKKAPVRKKAAAGRPAKAKTKAKSKATKAAPIIKKKPAKPTPQPEKRKPRRFPAADLRRFRKTLVAKRDELLHAYLSAKGDSRNRTLDGTEDYIDYAVSSYDREFLLSLTELDQKQLMLVEEALKRSERPRDYGRCAQCQQEIPVKRLEVQPWARYCLTCQELDEQGLLVADDRAEQDDDDDELDAGEIEDDVHEGEQDDDSIDRERLLGS